MKKIIKKNKAITYILILIVGIFLGWFIFGGKQQVATTPAHHQHEESTQWWTCSMHPSIKLPEKGKCPICGMNLIPLKTPKKKKNPSQIELDKEAIQLANIQTTTLQYSKAQKEIYLQGKIEVDERQIYTQAIHFAGRIDKLFISFEGEKVKQGQKLAYIYSPNLIVAQQELIEALENKDTYPEIFQTVINKLKQWKLTEAQINTIMQTKEIQESFEIVADASGVVTHKMVNVGDYVNVGDILFHITNLEQLWVVFDAYEKDLPFIKLGDKIEFTASAAPSKKFVGKVSFIDPTIDSQKRTTSVRIDIHNPNNLLKPEMFVNGKLTSNLSHKDRYIIIPKTALLWTGKRSIVYIKIPDKKMPTFEIREVELGETLGNSYIINSGLAIGEEIVTNGVFTIDAAAQLNNNYNMMNKPITP